jgi:hypothetical protein
MPITRRVDGSPSPRAARIQAIATGALVAISLSLVFVRVWPDPDRVTSTVVRVFVGLLLWIETLTVAAWVTVARWPGAQRAERVHALLGTGAVASVLGLPIVAWTVVLMSRDRYWPPMTLALVAITFVAVNTIANGIRSKRASSRHSPNQGAT